MVPHRTLVMVAIMCATIMQFLDATIANVAIPRMQVSLNASIDSVSWVLTSFMIATAISMPATGWISARYGSRATYIAALVGFVGSSMLCGAAASLGQMVAFRILQGMTAAFIGPLAQTIMLDMTEPKDHARVMGLWGMASMVGPIFGPTIGGFLTDELNWRWVFYINIPLGIPTLFVLWRYLPHSPHTPRPLDRFGYALIAISLCAFQLLLDRGQHEDWFNSWEIIIEGMVAVSALWMFGVHMMTAKHPIFPRELFRSPTFIIALFMTNMVGLVSVSVAAMLPGLFENVYGYSVIRTGMIMAPRGVGLLISMWFVPRLMVLVPRNLLLATGFAITAVSVYMACGWSLDMDSWPMLTSSFIQGIGLGLTMIPINLMAFGAVSTSLRADAAGVVNLIRVLGGSMGVSMFTTMLARAIQTSHADISGNLTQTKLPLLDPAIVSGFGEAGLTGVMQMLNAEVNRQAAMIAYIDIFSVMLVLTLVATGVCVFVRKS